ncbi:hypothetical protein HZS_6523 [Henneguya salminicola]|nr:hypothetical protein HZS_6523 [Henneguya salminicola]
MTPPEKLQNMFESEKNAISYLFETCVLSITTQCPLGGNQRILRNDKNRAMHPKELRVSNGPISIITGSSSITITRITRNFRKLGVTVSSSKSTKPSLGRVKCHRGHRFDGAWVLGSVDRTATSKLFLVKVSDRSENTL